MTANTENRLLVRYVATVCFGLLCATQSGGAPFEVERNGRAFTVTTPRLTATIRDACIASLTNRLSGTVHAAPQSEMTGIPRGMGHLGADPEAAAKLHMPWGTRSMGQEIKAGTPMPMMHHPDADSPITVQQTGERLTVTWTDLTNGVERFPDETITLTVAPDGESGGIGVSARAVSSTPGVYGVQVPLANLAAAHRIYVPSFGGIMYDSSMSAGLTTLGGAPFWEAPVIAAEAENGSVGIWYEDPEFHPNYAFINWDGETFSLAIEHLNLMPFDDLVETRSPTWHINVFEGGWVDAMTPYRDWYAQTFKAEFAIRNAVEWADRIRIIIDHFDKGDPAHYRRIATLFDPSTVMFHEWNARAPDFDHELPDWTPRAGYAERVRQLQAYGFKTMAYVNTYCVNVNSPVYRKDNVADFALTRKIRGFYRYTAPRQTLDTAKDGQLLYLDPLSEKWRKYHTDMMITWREQTGTDANYEDVGGTTGDFGNGVVDGRFGAQGGVEQFRELLERNSSVPMASEYATDAIAFAVRWPLRFQQVWGSDRTREFWMSHQRPVSAYIHGPLHRAWVPTIRAESNFLRHVVVACSDALGGLAQMPADRTSLEANSGILVHMKWRAQLFADRRLTPVFVPERQPDDLACMYADRDGGIYRYTATDTHHILLGPDGKECYARVTGVNRFNTHLNLPGWPAFDREGAVALNPNVRYALMPGVPDRTAIRISELTPGACITKFYTADGATVLSLDRAPDRETPAEATVQIQLLSPIKTILLNGNPDAPVEEADTKDREPELRSYSVDLPATWVFVHDNPQRLKYGDFAGDGHETGHFVVAESGLDRGGDYEPRYRANLKPTGTAESIPFNFVSGGGDAEILMEYLVQPPDTDASIEVTMHNRQNKYGNGTVGRLYINGVLVRERDLGPRPNPDWTEGMPKNEKNVWDNDFHRWTVPLGQFAAKPVLVTLGTDGKASNNADNHWWSRPRFVKDPDQKPRFVRLTADGPQPEDTGP